MNRLHERQEQLLKSIANSELGKQFYFGGGSALALFDLKHRVSPDLGFFHSRTTPYSTSYTPFA